MKARSPLFETALCAAAGIVAADALRAHAPVVWPLAAAAAFGALYLAWRGGRGRWVLWLGLAALFCFWSALREARNPARWLAEQTPAQGRPVEVEGVVDAEPRSARLPIRLERVNFGTGWVATRARVVLHWPGELPAYGDRVEVAGTLRNFGRPRNPGGFDLPAHRMREGLYGIVQIPYPADARVVAHGEGNPLIATSLRLRAWMARTIALGLEDDPQTTGIMQSMVLGVQGDSLGDAQELFRQTGTLHLFAVSGLNVAMLAGMVAGLLRILCVPHRAVALIALPVLWGYCFVTGLTASSLRATLMASAVLVGMALERPALSWNALGLAAVAILVWEPGQLYRIGFQLSFWMVVALLLWGRPVQEWLERRGAVDPFLPRVLWSRGQALWSRGWNLASGALAVSVVAWMASLPLVVWFFHLFSPSTVPANLVAGGLAWCMLALGLGAAVAGTFWSWLAITLNHANWLFTKALLGSLSLLASVPGSHFYMEPPTLHRPPVELTVLDLGEGGALHLRLRDGLSRTDWLVDCGSAGALRWSVLPYLRSRGVNGLEGLFLTHGDSKHLGGAVALVEEMPVGEVLDSAYKDRSPLRKRLHQWLAGQGRGKAIVQRGDVVTLAPGVVVRVLYPPSGRELRTANDKALVLLLEVGAGFRALLMSDAGFLTEQWLLENEADVRADLLIKGKHNHDLSGTPEFLSAVAPQVVIAGGADFPPMEQVEEAWAAGVEASGVRLLRQDRSGAVTVHVGADGAWNARGFYDGSTFLSRRRLMGTPSAR